MADPAISESASTPPDVVRKYAKLPVRIRSTMYDSILFALAILIVISLATASGTNVAARIIGTIGVLLILLYEPVMVWAKGGTFGHMACNLRVVDDRTLGNPSLPKATARFLIKVILGLFSFVTMMASSRQRAIHDAMTGSTVQIRNVNREKSYDFAPVASQPARAKVPSAKWRAFGIVVYSLLSIAALILLSAVLSGLDIFSIGCIDHDQCTLVERAIFSAIGLSWFASLFVIIGFGWRGRLFGFRTR